MSTILMVGTRKGMWIGTADDQRHDWEFTGPHFDMEEAGTITTLVDQAGVDLLHVEVRPGELPLAPLVAGSADHSPLRVPTIRIVLIVSLSRRSIISPRQAGDRPRPGASLD